MTTKRTDELAVGDVLVIEGRHVRTVARVAPNGYVNSRNEPLYNVDYAEGDTAEWCSGNSGAPASLWVLAEQCGANVGGNPAGGCDGWSIREDLCLSHASALSV